MEEHKTKRFSGDSFGNLDRSNAGPDMETEIAEPTGLTNGRPDYKRHELMDHISVVILNPFMNTSADDTEQNNENKLHEIRKQEDAVKVSDTSILESNEDSNNFVNASTEDKPFNNYDTLQRDDLSSEVVLPIPIEPETDTFEDNNGTDCNNVVHGNKMEENSHKSEDIQEFPTDLDESGHGSEDLKESDTGRMSISDPLKETDTEEANEAVAGDSNSNRDKDSSDDYVDVEQEKGEEVEEGSDCLLLESPTRPQTRSTLREVPGGMRAKANTPASLYTNTAEGLDSPGTPQAGQIDSVR